MSLSVAICHRLGVFDLDVNFETSGRLTAIFGTSGSGKTSILNVIAGLSRPEQGRIEVDGHVLLDTKKGIFLPPSSRGIGYVFQDGRLFPHLTVRQNLLYGRWFARKRGRTTGLAFICDLLGIDHLLDRRPQRLSGGEKQRVAIGRALLSSPRLLLMDEPMASLDEQRKAEIIPYIERLRDETAVPIVYVSHSIAEISQLATDIVFIENGKAVAAGKAADMMQRLDLMPPGERREGGSLVEGTVSFYEPGYDSTTISSPVGDIRLPGNVGEKGDRIKLRIRAQDVIVATEEPRSLSALNIFRGRVASIGDRPGSSVPVVVDCNGAAILASITRQSLAILGLAPGKPVFLIVKAVALEEAGVAGGRRISGTGDHSV